MIKDDDYLHLQREEPSAQILWVKLGNCRNRRLLSAFESAWPDLSKYLDEGSPLVILRKHL